MNLDDINVSELINILLRESKKMLLEREIPVSALICDSMGNVICVEGNSRQHKMDVLNHAEINAIETAEEIIGDWRLNGYYMFTTLEPCEMCSMVISKCRIEKVYYLLSQSSTLNNDFNIDKVALLDYEDEKKEAKKLLTDFFDYMRI